MQHMQDSIHIDAPVEHVWAFCLDTSHWSDWMPRAEHSDFSGPLDQVGTTYVERWRMMGHEFKSTSKVVEVVPQRLYHDHTDLGPMDTYLRFEPDGSGTLVTIESDYEMPGHLPKFIQDLMSRSWIERQTRQMLQDLKALAEATVPVSV